MEQDLKSVQDAFAVCGRALMDQFWIEHGDFTSYTLIDDGDMLVVTTVPEGVVLDFKMGWDNLKCIYDDLEKTFTVVDDSSHTKETYQLAMNLLMGYYSTHHQATVEV